MNDKTSTGVDHAYGSAHKNACDTAHARPYDSACDGTRAATANLARVIASQRRRRGITQEELAQHLGVTKAAVSKWDLGQSLPDVALLPRIAAFFSLSMDELFDYHVELPEAESAAIYARLYHEYESDPAQAYAHLHEEATEHYSDWRLLVMLASLLSGWATLGANPLGTQEAMDDSRDDEAGAKGILDSEAFLEEALGLLDRTLAGTSDATLAHYACQLKGSILFQKGQARDAIDLLEPLVPKEDVSSIVMLLAAAHRQTGETEQTWRLLQVQRFRAVSLITAALAMEMRMADDPVYARKAAQAGEEVCRAFGMQRHNPYVLVSLKLDLAEVMRRCGDTDAALDTLEQAIDLVAELETSERKTDGVDLFGHIRDILDSTATRDTPLDKGDRSEPNPAVRDAWAQHKEKQARDFAAIMRRGIAELVREPKWQALADNPRYQAIARKADELASK